MLSREELRENPDLFSEMASAPALQQADRQLLTGIEAQIKAGKFEMLFRSEGSAVGFADNINIAKQVGRLPDEGNLAEYCKQAELELAAAFGRPIKVYACALATVSPIYGTYLEYEGLVAGTRGMAYQLRKSQSVQLIVTATASDQTAGEVKDDLETLVRSLEFLPRDQ
ncbi:MAG: hypothetical protein ACQGVK_11595 [Myxococcota bacterium]